MAKLAPLDLALSSEDFASVRVEVGLGLLLTLTPRDQSLFSSDFLSGYVFYVLCPKCEEPFTRQGVYEPKEGKYSCRRCQGSYSVTAEPSPWWASKTGVEKIAGLVTIREERGGDWLRSGASAAEIVAALEKFDGFDVLEAFVAPHYDPLESRLATVELGDKLEEVFVAWKKASRRRKPEFRQAEFEAFMGELSA